MKLILGKMSTISKIGIYHRVKGAWQSAVFPIQISILTFHLVTQVQETKKCAATMLKHKFTKKH